jgi:hypothetical protein
VRLHQVSCEVVGGVLVRALGIGRRIRVDTIAWMFGTVMRSMSVVDGGVAADTL